MSKPTKEDAELFLRYFGIMRSDEDFKKAAKWFHSELDAKSYKVFKKKYPTGSEGYGNLMLFASYWEVLSTLVNNGLLNEDLVFDMFLFPWKKVEPIVYGLRKELKAARLFENFEALARRLPKWEKRHPPKVK